MIYQRRSYWGVLLEILIFGLLFCVVLQICMCIVYLIAKLGCTQVFEPQGTDLNDPF